MTATVECDVLVVGGGAGGLTGALTAARRDLRVLLVEKTDHIGGTAAYAGAGLWLPLNPVTEPILDDTREQVDAYLDAILGGTGSDALRRAYLDAAPEMVRELLEDPALAFDWRPFPDYFPGAPGYQPRGRAIFPAGLPRADVGELAALLRPELPLVRGGHDTGDRLAGGQALLGRLLLACARRRVELRLGTALNRLLRADGRVVGAVVTGPEGELTVRARRGVLLAAGGFDHDRERRAAHGHPVEPGWTMGAPGGTGEVLTEARRAGAAVASMDEAWWTPAFLTPDGPAFRVHFRGHPGSVVVDQDGRRFVNESLPYDQIGRAFRAGALDGSLKLPCWFVADRRFVERYGLNGEPPGAPVPPEWLEGGFAYTARTLEDLAVRLNLPADGLRATVDRFNGFARAGVDEDFGRGGNAFDLHFGDPEVGPNPALAPLEQAPFYALPMVLSDLGTKGGVQCDRHARVLDERGAPITGLHATGNVMAGWSGSAYPGPGVPIGSSMVFGYLAALHLATAPRAADTAASSGAPR